jgi:hypothetical protein
VPPGQLLLELVLAFSVMFVAFWLTTGREGPRG